MTVSAMRDERLEVSVTFDERRGYVASAPELRAPRRRRSRGRPCARRGGALPP
jgi:hypothetical protein